MYFKTDTLFTSCTNNMALSLFFSHAQDGRTALLLACYHGRELCVRALCAARPPPNLNIQVPRGQRWEAIVAHTSFSNRHASFIQKNFTPNSWPRMNVALYHHTRRF
jgi:ankyrin repeat protein